VIELLGAVSRDAVKNLVRHLLHIGVRQSSEQKVGLSPACARRGKV
jgi:hypothetical protein